MKKQGLMVVVSPCFWQ